MLTTVFFGKTGSEPHDQENLVQTDNAIDRKMLNNNMLREHVRMWDGRVPCIVTCCDQADSHSITALVAVAYPAALGSDDMLTSSKGDSVHPLIALRPSTSHSTVDEFTADVRR